MEAKGHRLNSAIIGMNLIAVACLLLISPAWLMAQGGSGERRPTPTPTPPVRRPTPRVNPPVRRPPARPNAPSGMTAARRAQIIQSIRENLVLIPAGSFMMGSNQYQDERPVHQVNVRAFYMGRYEVTQAQYRAVMGANPSYFRGDNLPVENVNWNDAQEFMRRLNALSDGYTYRLPTEAEWEYACRARTTGDYAGDLDAMAWYGDNSGRTRLNTAEIWRTDRANYDSRIIANGNQTHAVGTRQPNSFGLYDMHGNVWEWCADWYHDNYNGAPSDGSAWLSGGTQQYRVLRGGSWYDYPLYLRSAHRAKNFCSLSS